MSRLFAPARRAPRRAHLRLRIESLEGRALLSGWTLTLEQRQEIAAIGRSPHHQAVHATAAHDRMHPLYHRTASPHLGGNPPTSALTPAQVRHIYGFDQVANLGEGQTIAIVDAYDDPTIFADADYFDQAFKTTLNGSTTYYSAYGASSTWLTKAYASGTKPATSSGWSGEIALDVEWAHAIAPKAKILLVEAASSSFADLMTAVDYATSHGASVVSNSYGSSEFAGETSYDSHFNHSNVTYVFSSGDGGTQSYPAMSPYVVSVGGTTLAHDASSNWTGETGWSGSGGGVSTGGGGRRATHEARPSYQSSLPYSYRANPDVAYDADPYSGFAVYDATGTNGWGQYGGTSAGAPQWAALIALADQGRAAGGKTALTGATQTLPALYALGTGTSGTTPLQDILTGRNRVASATAGYDLVTGRGTPRRADLVIAALASY